MHFIDVDSFPDYLSFYSAVFKEHAPALISTTKYQDFLKFKQNGSLLKAEENRISKKVQNFLQDYLCSRFNSEKSGIIQLHWPAVLRQAFFNSGLKFEDGASLLNASVLRTIFKELDEIIVGIEAKGLDFYSDIEMVEGEDSANIVKYLLYDIALDRSQVTWENFRKIFLKQDRMLLSDLRKEFQKVFVLLHKRLEKGFEHEDVIVEMIVGNLLSFYAFTEPVAGERLSVPQKKKGVWTLVEYQVELIELTPPLAWGPHDCHRP